MTNLASKNTAETHSYKQVDTATQSVGDIPELESALEAGLSGKRVSISVVLKVLLSLGLMAFILSQFMTPNVWVMVYQFQWSTLIIATFCILMSLVAATKRWMYLLTHMKMRAWQTFEVVMIGFFFNQCLPGSIGGDVYRVWSIKKINMISWRQAFNSVFLDRFFGFMALGFVCMLAIPFQWDKIIASELSWPLLSSGGVLVAASGMFIFLIYFREYFKKFKFYGLLWDLVNLLKSNFTHKRLVVSLILTSCCVHFFLLGCMYVLAQDLDIHLSLAQGFVVVPLVLFLSSLPISFAGWGIREGAMVVALGAYNVPSDKALVLSLAYGILQIVISLPGFAMWLAKKKEF